MDYSRIVKIYNLLNDDESVATAGFMVGFLYRFKFNNRTLDNPLSTILKSSVVGAATSLGASFVGDLLPYSLKFIVPVTSFFVIVHYKIADLKELD